MDLTVTIATLTAYADHLDAHPHLADSLTSSSLGNHSHMAAANLVALVFDHQRGHLGALVAWVRTLNEPDDVRITATSCHVAVTGQLADGTEITVRSVFDEDEIELLRANNVKIKVGETFPVELLLRLTSSVAAEAVSR